MLKVILHLKTGNICKAVLTPRKRASKCSGHFCRGFGKCGPSGKREKSRSTASMRMTQQQTSYTITVPPIRTDIVKIASFRPPGVKGKELEDGAETRERERREDGPRNIN